MIEDDVVTRLVALHDHIAAPATPVEADALRGQRRLRRRRALVTAAAAVVAAGLGIAALTTSEYRAQDRLVPVQPGPTQDVDRSDADWPLARIREEGTRSEESDLTASGIRTRLYVVCDGPSSACGGFVLGRVQFQHAALEVSRGGQTALFDVAANEQYSVQQLGEDAVLVVDDPSTLSELTPRSRHRVLRPDGTEVELRYLDQVAPARAGPTLVLLSYRTEVLSGGPLNLYHVDLAARTLQPVDAPHDAVNGILDWGPNIDEFVWAVGKGCEVHWASADGTFTKAPLECSDDLVSTLVGRSVPDGWLRPGRMVVEEQTNRDRLLLHVTSDYGSTWQRIPVDDDPDAIREALRRVG